MENQRFILQCLYILHIWQDRKKLTIVSSHDLRLHLVSRHKGHIWRAGWLVVLCRDGVGRMVYRQGELWLVVNWGRELLVVFLSINRTRVGWVRELLVVVLRLRISCECVCTIDAQ